MTSDTFRFYVTGDPHFSDTHDDRYKDISDMVKHITSSTDFQEHKFLFLLGDMTNTTHEKQLQCYKDVFIMKLNEHDKHCILCDGLGNHDMYRNSLRHNYKDMYTFIQRQNAYRSSSISTEKEMSIYVAPSTKKPDGSGLHYHITVAAVGTKLHFINLNLLPINANKRVVDTQYIYGNNALNFLRLRLKDIPTYEPVFIFSHIGFITLDEWGPDKYWDENDRKNFLYELNCHTIGGIFCGHVHGTGMINRSRIDNVPKKYIEMLEEYQLYNQCVLAGGATQQSYSLTRLSRSKPNYQCRTRYRAAGFGCMKGSVKEGEIASVVLAAVQAYIQTLMDEKELLVKAGNSDILASLQKQVAAYQGACAKIDEQKAELYDAMADERISREKYQREREKLSREQENMARLAETAETELTELRGRLDVAHRGEPKLMRYLQADSLTRQMVVDFVDCIYVYNDKSIHIKWTFSEKGAKYESA